jgi:hypothetical protein
VAREEFRNKKLAIHLLKRARSERDLAKTKLDLIMVMTNAVDAADTEMAELRRVGAPDVEEGDEIQAIVEDVWRQIRAAYTDYQRDVRQIRAKTREAFQRRLNVVNNKFSAKFDRIGSTIDKLDEKHSAELDTSVKVEGDCASPIFRGSAGPAPDFASLVRGFVSGDV